MAKVSVPKSAGDEIQISRNGDEPKTYRVTDGHITVASDDLEHVLNVVEGSKQAGGTTTATKER